MSAAPSQDTDRYRNVVVIGASGHGKVVLDLLSGLGGIRLAGLLDDFKPVGSRCLDLPVSGTLNHLSAFDHLHPEIIVAVGDNFRRARIVDEILSMSPNARFATAIHPSAVVGSEVTIGPGSAILAGAVIGPGSIIGSHCIVNTRASLDHDSTMEDFSSLAPAAVTGGNVHLGAFSNVGIGASVLQDISVGAHTIIGAGSVVLNSVPAQVVAYGTPARIVRGRRPGDRYLGDAAMAIKELQTP